MTHISNRNTSAPLAPDLQPPACLRSASHNAIPVRYRNRFPKSRHLAPRIADPCAVCNGSIANAIAPNRISPVQIPIAPRRC
jgi:hypothetical protein